MQFTGLKWTREPDKVISVEQMRRSDAYTIAHFVPSKELMYRAAKGVFDAFDGWRGKRIAIFKGEVRGKAGDAIKAINAAHAYVVSVDINSGMNGDTGEAHLAVKSDLTVSIGYYKQGQFKGDADKYIGSLKNADVGIILVD